MDTVTTSLAVKYRPKLLKDFLGNEQTVKKLRALLEREEKPHAILFTGPSGCGKTTLARIVATALRCSKHDFQEHNAADFRGIDSVRDIISQMRLCPMSGPCRVWLLDECHQLSKDAQHALLKALEDTPPHVYFILATTEPEKLLPTIKTRCPPYEVRALPDEQLMRLLMNVTEAEGVEVPEEALEQIVQDSLGSSRMALTILDGIINLEPEEMAAAAKVTAEQRSESISLCRAMLGKGRVPWKVVGKILDGIPADQAEQVRRLVLGYCQSILVKGDDPQAYAVMACFRQDFFTTGKPGLVLAAYEATH